MEHKKYLERCIELSLEARKEGNNPFGAILVDEEGNILLEQKNIEGVSNKCTGHAETQLMEQASIKYEKDFLWKCTLYSSAEPCVMCTGAIYWGNVGNIVYILEEEDLLECTGADPRNPTFNVPCREVIKKGQKNINVVGPYDELKEKALIAHKDFWN